MIFLFLATLAWHYALAPLLAGLIPTRVRHWFADWNGW